LSNITYAPRRECNKKAILARDQQQFVLILDGKLLTAHIFPPRSCDADAFRMHVLAGCIAFLWTPIWLVRACVLNTTPLTSLLSKLPKCGEKII
jgi:hypothetical protein